jgi:hypothetical protein
MDIINSQFGETITIIDISHSEPDRWGETTETETEYQIKGHVQLLSSEDDGVREGKFDIGDLQAFFDKDTQNISKVELGNKIYYDGVYYKIQKVIKEPLLRNQGHYEVYAERM